MKTKEINLIVEVRDGCISGIYGDKAPKDIQLNFVVRDLDNIFAGDPDPVAEAYIPEIYYW